MKVSRYNYSKELVSKIEAEYGKNDRISVLAREGSVMLDEYIYSNLIGINQFILHTKDDSQKKIALANMDRRRQLYNAVFDEQIKEEAKMRSSKHTTRVIDKSKTDTSRVR